MDPISALPASGLSNLSGVGGAGGVGGIGGPGAPGATGRTGKASFGDALKQAIDSVNADQNRADAMQRAYQSGEPRVGLEETMLATQTANVSFQALVQVRNRLVSAYHDIMNMQV